MWTVTEKEDSIHLSPALVKLGTKEYEFISFLAKGTPKDKTFLHEYAERNGKGIDAIQNVYDWERKTTDAKTGSGMSGRIKCSHFNLCTGRTLV